MSQLTIFNGALLHLGERNIDAGELATPTSEPTRVLTQIWDDGFEDYILAKGQWKFAMTSDTLTENSGSGKFGFEYQFTKPTDFIRFGEMCVDEDFSSPAMYGEGGGKFYADEDTLYIQYVSNDNALGGDLTLWTEAVLMYAKAHLAFLAAPKLNPDLVDKLYNLENKYLFEAQNRDAFSGPTRELPPGRWRRSRGFSSQDRGSRSNLIG